MIILKILLISCSRHSDDREGQALALRYAGDFCSCSDDREGQALALRCVGDFCLCLGSREGQAVRQHRDREVSPTLWSDAREGQALALRCEEDFREARDFLLKKFTKNLTN